MTVPMRLVFCLLSLGWGVSRSVAVDPVAISPIAIMPRQADRTTMWWQSGFPSHGTDIPWHRCVQSETYGFVLDTQSMQIPHFGSLDGDKDVKTLPAAQLNLRIDVGGKVYRCTAGGKWSTHGGPRLIESGRFFQRADVTDLVFATDDGDQLGVDARFETAAWSDRLALILAARPNTAPTQTAKSQTAWKSATLAIELRGPNGLLSNSINLSDDGKSDEGRWNEVSLVIDPVAFTKETLTSEVNVGVVDIASGHEQPTQYDASLGWHRINLDGVAPILPGDVSTDAEANQNNSMERIKLVLSNPTDREQTARLMFEKTSSGIRQPIGSPVTGVSAVLRDTSGRPTGIPVQLSKNWHTDEAAGVYRGLWFHGISRVPLPAGARVELELSIVYGHWGGVPAASHAQLCLIGWGSNQRWDQTALGAWGESICYESDQVQADCGITDVRPMMVRATDDAKKWRWTCNVGGGDWFRMFDSNGDRIHHAAMKTTEHRQGPCFTEVTFDGRFGTSIQHSSTVSLARTDDIVRATYRLRMSVTEATDFARLVIFQVGADTYSYTGERKMAIGDETGLIKEWSTQWGGNTYRTQPFACTGRVPWMSLHDGVSRSDKGEQEAWANRGLVIRSWRARLGGRDAAPWVAERGVRARGHDSSTLDILPPPATTRLQPGDFVDATIEHIVMPQYARQYYGPDQALRSALKQHENSWPMIFREATKNDRQVQASLGNLQHTHPDVRIETVDDEAKLTLAGGLGYVPITFTGLSSPTDNELFVDGRLLDQSVHGNDFWQTDYDGLTKLWSRTYNLNSANEGTQIIELRRPLF